MDKNLFLPVLKFSLQRDRPRNLKNGGASQGNVEFFAVILHLILKKLLSSQFFHSAFSLFKKTPERSKIETQIEGLHEAILSILLPESTADERRRSEIYNSVPSLDYLNKAVGKKGFNLSRTATYHRLLRDNMRHKDGKRNAYTVPVKLCCSQNDLRKKHRDSHFAMAMCENLQCVFPVPK